MAACLVAYDVDSGFVYGKGKDCGGGGAARLVAGRCEGERVAANIGTKRRCVNVDSARLIPSIGMCVKKIDQKYVGYLSRSGTHGNA